jgi:hypothetical protein
LWREDFGCGKRILASVHTNTKATKSIYAQVSIRKLKEIHTLIHPARKER